jgi:hypothetical protein
MEPQPYAKSMQTEMIRQIELAHPRYLVYSQVGGSWLAREHSDRGIINWADQYVHQCYEHVGVADISFTGKSPVLWGDEMRAYTPSSDARVYSFRRKSDAPCTVSQPNR